MPPPRGVYYRYERNPVHEPTLALMKSYNFDPAAVRRLLEANKHNHATATYFLLLKRRQAARPKRPS